MHKLRAATTLFRRVGKHRTNNTVMLLGLAVAYSFMIAITQYVFHELSYDEFWSDADNIYRVQATITDAGSTPINYAKSNTPLLGLLKEHFSEIEAGSRVFTRQTTFNLGNSLFEETIPFVDPDFLNVFDLEFIHGSKENALNELNNIVLSESLANRLFGAETPIGKTLSIRLHYLETRDYRVVGVFKDLPINTHFNFTALAPLFDSDLPPHIVTNWRAALVYTYIKLRPGTDPGNIESKLPELEQKTVPDWGGYDVADNLINKLYAIEELRLYQNGQGDFKASGTIKTLYVYVLAGLLLLFIAATNFINTMFVQAQFRVKETSLRKVFGANTLNILTQFLPEAILVSLSAFYLSIIGFEFWGDQIFDLIGYQGEQTREGLFLSGGFVVVLAVILAVIASTVPTVKLTVTTPIDALRSRTTDLAGSMKFSKWLMTFQFVIATFIIIVGGTIWAQTHYAETKNLGYDPEGVFLLLNVPEDAGQAANIFQQFSNIPGIIASARTMAAPSTGPLPSAGFSRPDHNQSTQFVFPVQFVASDFLNVFTYKLLAGRFFSEEITKDAYANKADFNILVNEATVRKLGYATPEAAIGQHIWWGNKETKRFLTIVGVLADTHHMSLKTQIEPLLFMMRDGFYFNFAFRIDKGHEDAVLKQMSRIWRSTLSEQVFAGEFLEDRLRAQYGPELQILEYLKVAGILGVLMSCLGLYAVSSFILKKQQKEFAIRRVLGASFGQTWQLAVARSIKPVFAAILIAFPLAYIYLADWLQGFAYRINMPFELFVFAAAGTIIVATFSVNFVAHKITKIPVALLLAEE